MNNKNVGKIAEQRFSDMLDAAGLSFSFDDDYYDFSIDAGDKKILIDVKSTAITHKFTNSKRKNQQYKIGQFKFTKEQREEKMYVAFFASAQEDVLFLGIAKLNKNSPPHITLHDLRRINTMSFDDFIKQIKKGDKYNDK